MKVALEEGKILITDNNDEPIALIKATDRFMGNVLRSWGAMMDANGEPENAQVLYQAGLISDNIRLEEGKDKHVRGLFRKYTVRRMDGSSAPGGRHENCDYFVLDLTHDKFAKTAIKAYAEACIDEYPVLSVALMSKVDNS